MKHILVWMALLWACVGSAWAENDVPTSITVEQAIEIARQYAMDEGTPEYWFADHGGDAMATYHEDHWFVGFTRSEVDDQGNRFGVIGNHFMVVLSADGEPLRISPGS